MNRCPNCNQENLPTSTFCENCGASLAPSSSPLEPTQRPFSESAIPPPPPGFEKMPTLFSPVKRQQYRRTLGGTIHSLLWYLVGIAIFCFGLGGGLLNDMTGEAIGLIAFLSFLAGLVILIPVLLYRQSFVLRGQWRLLLEIILVFVGLIMLVGVSLIKQAAIISDRTETHAFGIVFAAYGI